MNRAGSRLRSPRSPVLRLGSRSPRLAVLAVLAVLLVTLAGCGGLPLPRGTATVRPVSVGQAPADADVVRRIPQGPALAATPQQVVTGFLAAGADTDIAREFLTPGNAWDPLQETTVFSSSAVDVTTKGTHATAVVRLTPQVAIADDGSTTPGSSAPITLGLVRALGVWRIASLPAGTLLQSQDFGSSYRRASIAWLAPDRRGLVRESVLLPGDSEALLPDLARALLQGPSTRLSLAGVTTGLPSRLTVVSAVQSGSEVDIDLAGPGENMPVSDAQAARAQVAATMLSLPGVATVRVTSSGQPLLLNVSGLDTPITAADTAGFDRDDPQPGVAAVRLSGSDLGPLIPAPSLVQPTLSARPSGQPAPQPSRSPQPSLPVQPPAVGMDGPVTQLAVAGDGERVAELRTVTGGHVPVTLTVASSTSTPVAGVGNWTSLSWGANSTLWLVRDGVPYVATRDRVAQRVALANGATLPALQSLLIEPDGVHAVGVAAGSGTLLAGLVDAYAGTPLLTDVHAIAPSLSAVSAVAVAGFDPENPQLMVSGRYADGGSSSVGLWRVAVGAPDPGLGADDESLVQPVPAACPHRGTPLSLTGLVLLPPLANCGDAMIRELRSDDMWITVAAGMAAYPSD